MRVDVQCGVDERSACKHGLVVSVSRSSIRYLALADKAARTLAMLTERLDHHRGRGQQQIVVKHVTTVNADQAVITESIMTGKTAGKDTREVAAGADRTMQIIEPSQKEAVPVGGGSKRK
jgi:hypothetical protein